MNKFRIAWKKSISSEMENETPFINEFADTPFSLKISKTTGQDYISHYVVSKCLESYVPC